MKKFLTSKWGLFLTFTISVVIAKLTGHMEALAAMPFVFGTVDRVAGQPDYTQDGSNKNIPWAFSRKTLVKFYDTSIAGNICNTDYEGEIKGMGDKVIINTLPDVNIQAYKKGGTVNWQLLESDGLTMTVDRANYFAFKMDKVDLAQFANKKYMDEASNDASSQQKIYIDNEFLLNIGGIAAGGTDCLASSDNFGQTAGRKTSSYNLGYSGNAIALTKTNILDKILDLSGVAAEQNWPEDNRFVVLPSHFTTLLKQSDLKDASMTGDSKSTLRSGRLGMIDNWELFSSNLYTAISDTNNCYTVLFGHRSGISFATQLLDTEYFDKLETTFGKGMKGLQVYDWKVVKSTSLGMLYAYKG